MTTTILRRTLALAGALAALGASAPAAGAGAIDPAIYASDVPIGQVVHGVMSSSLTGAPRPYDWRVEYWIGPDRWREQTTDAKTGELIGGRIHDASGTTWLQYRPVNGDPRVLHFKGQDSVPGPGTPAAYNRKLVETGVLQGSDAHPITVTLQPTGPRTIAGFAGTAYEQLSNGQPGVGEAAGSHATLVLEDGTLAPLLREWTLPKGSGQAFRQREVLLSRQTLSSGATSVLTRPALARTVARWKAKVRALRATGKHHKK
jgi:hypothetical protein